MDEQKPRRQVKVPCPFCGGTESLSTYEGGIRCYGCDAEGPIPVTMDKWGPVPAAYKVWNKRVADPGEGCVVPSTEIPVRMRESDGEGIVQHDGLLVKPCPFCGKGARPVATKTDWGLAFRVECSGCHSHGRNIGKGCGSNLNRIKYAVSLWNTRASVSEEAGQ